MSKQAAQDLPTNTITIAIDIASRPTQLNLAVYFQKLQASLESQLL